MNYILRLNGCNFAPVFAIMCTTVRQTSIPVCIIALEGAHLAPLQVQNCFSYRVKCAHKVHGLYLYPLRCRLTPLTLPIPGGQKNPEQVDILGLCSDQQLSFFTLLDRASFPHYNNTKIIKFG